MKYVNIIKKQKKRWKKRSIFPFYVQDQRILSCIEGDLTYRNDIFLSVHKSPSFSLLNLSTTTTSVNSKCCCLKNMSIPIKLPLHTLSFLYILKPLSIYISSCLSSSHPLSISLSYLVTTIMMITVRMLPYVLSGTNPCANKCRKYERCNINRQGVAECVCPTSCEPVLRPICGSDGVTYDNECQLQKDACQNELPISLKQRGPCGKTTWKNTKSQTYLCYQCQPYLTIYHSFLLIFIW